MVFSYLIVANSKSNLKILGITMSKDIVNLKLLEIAWMKFHPVKKNEFYSVFFF